MTGPLLLIIFYLYVMGGVNLALSLHESKGFFSKRGFALVAAWPISMLYVWTRVVFD